MPPVGVAPTSGDSLAVVTGGTSGIGLAFARRLASFGFRLMIVSRTTADAAAVLSTLPGTGHEHVAADLSDARDLARVADLLGSVTGLEVLVNAAGHGVAQQLPFGDLDDELSMLDLNVRAPLTLTHAAVSAMLPARHGTLVNVASTSGLWSGGTYSASKSWVIKFSTGLATALEGTGVRAVCVAPGFTRTPFFDSVGIHVGARRNPWLWLDSEVVVDECLRAVARGRSLVVPTFRYRVLVRVALMMPTGARRRLVAAIGRAAGVGRPG